jgi:putative FmdB family regulatory protein
MPFFDFKCQSCDGIHEAFLTRYDAPPPICPFCGVITRRIYTVAFTSGDKPMIMPGKEYNSFSSDCYNHPDHPKGSRMWRKFGYNCQRGEDAGKLEKIPGGDGIEKSIKAFERAGQ